MPEYPKLEWARGYLAMPNVRRKCAAEKLELALAEQVARAERAEGADRNTKEHIANWRERIVDALDVYDIGYSGGELEDIVREMGLDLFAVKEAHREP